MLQYTHFNIKVILIYKQLSMKKYNVVITALLFITFILPALADNFTEELIKKEKELLKKYPQYLKKKDEDYIITLKNKKRITVETCPKENKDRKKINVFGATHDCLYPVSYYRSNYILDVIGEKYLLIRHGHYEGFGYSLVSLDNGNNVYSKEKPYISPDKKHFITTCGDYEVSSQVLIYKIGNNGFKQVFSFNCSKGNGLKNFTEVRFLSWQNPNNINVELYRYVESGIRKKTIITYDSNINQWKLVN